MLIVIDLVGDGETLVNKGGEDELKRLDEERQRNEWLDYIRRNEQVLPQIVPIVDG